jgi:hypothetical protein
MKKIFVLIFLLICNLVTAYAHAGNLGIGIHAGYGTLEYEEEGRSESTQNVLFYGLSGEYTLKSNSSLFTGFVIDWGTGFDDDEQWRAGGTQMQSNDIRFFGQFYDVRFGFKGNYEDYYYRAYLAGGRDVLRFKRDGFRFTGPPLQPSGTEKIKLWRTSLGTGFGRRVGEWAFDGRIAYSLHPSGTVEYSAYPDIAFDTEGTCIDGGAGLATAITEKMGFYAGISYSLIELDESDVKMSGSEKVDFPGSTTEILVGMLNLTCAF